MDLNSNQITLRRTKDAVTDRGVVVVDGERFESLETPIFSHNSCNRVVAGTSLVARENYKQAWRHAIDSHETQMGNNPCCNVFVTV